MNRCRMLGLHSIFGGSKVFQLSIVPTSKWQLMLCQEVGCQFHQALGVNATSHEQGANVYAKGAKLHLNEH